MENYRRVRNRASESVDADPSDVLVTSLGNPVLLAREVKPKLETGDAKITLKAMGQAIGKAVSVAELLKRHVPGLHQLTTTTTVSLTDIWEPTVEGLERIETKRLVSAIEITLSKAPLDASAVSQSLADGQAELEALEASLDSRGPSTRARGGRGRGRGPRGRGGRGRRATAAENGEHVEAEGGNEE